MNRFVMASFAVLLSSVTLAAQTPGPAAVSSQMHGSSSVYVVPGTGSLGCPVSIRAQHGAGGGLVMTRQSRSAHDPGQVQPAGPSQQIHLILGKAEENSSADARVVRAKVTVGGTNGKWRTVPTGLASDATSEVSKTLEVTFEIAENGQVSTDLTLPGFTSVKSIVLDSLAFSDGSTWAPSQGEACHVAPDPLMLVSQR
jgi:hypothetical protein